jgi:hypothetical protein
MGIPSTDDDDPPPSRPGFLDERPRRSTPFPPRPHEGYGDYGVFVGEDEIPTVPVLPVDDDDDDV